MLLRNNEADEEGRIQAYVVDDNDDDDDAGSDGECKGLSALVPNRVIA